MKNQDHIPLINESREFGIDELFFSTTDQRGIILSGNAVFARVSGHPMENLFQQPHNIIRHPHMPRVVFKLLWDTIKADQCIAAYVKNLACDGRHYWVMAMIAPTRSGYLSVRFKPSSSLFATVESLYADLLKLENERLAAGDTPAQAMLAAEAKLSAALQVAGFRDYVDFMRRALHQELASRDEITHREGLELAPPPPPSLNRESPAVATLDRLFHDTRGAYQEIIKFGHELSGSLELHQELATRSGQILRLTQEFHHVPFNVAIKSTQLGNDGRSLSVIAQHLGSAYSDLIELVSDLTGKASSVAQGLSDAVFYLSWARLQFEMTLIYYRELWDAATGEGPEPNPQSLATVGHNLTQLRLAFDHTAQTTAKALQNADKTLRKLDTGADDLAKTMLRLQVSHVAGIVEVSRLTENTEFVAIFHDIRSHISRTQDSIKEFGSTIERLRNLARRTPEVTTAIATADMHMQRGESQLGAGEISSRTTPPSETEDPFVDRPAPRAEVVPTLSGVT